LAVAADWLYFVTLRQKKPRSSAAIHYFSTDDEFVYNRLLALAFYQLTHKDNTLFNAATAFQICA